MAIVSVILFLAYTILINIFWTYVININKEMEKKNECKSFKS